MDCKIVCVISIVLIGASSCLKTQLVGKEDIYVNRLVYLKKDSTLFSGTLKGIGKSSYFFKRYCKGIPCGEWSEHQNGGGVIQKGKYLERGILSNASEELIKSDVITLNHWQEGELSTSEYPPYLSVVILKNDVFFENENYHTYAHEIATMIMYDTRNLKFDNINIVFSNAVRDDDKFFNVRYLIHEGKLILHENN